ncbi:homoserine kinase [uncultured Desulfovibrio sp.]|uniref:homoserine kinase n=1 Tax=uncultured Desulfovibrio sp. TaxID=167968 RepID=UPI0026E93411|nr:homoserine kinase [uncultured Desulfovibrio sp.]
MSAADSPDPSHGLVSAPADALPCVILIGMAGSGKSTIGARLALEMDWAFLDSDHLMEALYGCRLQDLTDALDRDAFLDVECAVIRAIRARRAVIATGGSVVYREAAMRHLASLGHVVYLDVPLDEIQRRIARNPPRGLSLGPGQTVADLYHERAPLYAAWAALRCDAARGTPGRCARWILNHLPPEFQTAAGDADPDAR